MPSALIHAPLEAPTYHDVRFVYLARHEFPIHDARALYYLQMARNGALGECPSTHPVTLSYEQALPRFTAELAALTTTFHPSVLLSPPSSREDATPYRRAIQAVHRGAIDFTSCFARSPGAAAGDGATVPQLEQALSFTPPHAIPGDGEVAIVDDVLRNGTTVTAILNHLARHGIASRRAVLICPLWLFPPRAFRTRHGGTA